MLDSFAEKKKTPSGRLTLILLGVFFIACFIGALFVGDLAKLQEPVFAKESQAALRDVDDAAGLDQVLQKYSANRMLRLVALAKRDATDLDAAARKLVAEAEPAALAKPVDLTAASRADLDALRASLKAAEGQAAIFQIPFRCPGKGEARRDREGSPHTRRRQRYAGEIHGCDRRAACRHRGLLRQGSGGACRAQCRLRQMRSTAGQGIRLLQDHQRPVHFPRAIDGGQLQRGCGGDGGGSKAHRGAGRGGVSA